MRYYTRVRYFLNYTGSCIQEAGSPVFANFAKALLCTPYGLADYLPRFLSALEQDLEYNKALELSKVNKWQI